MNRNLVPRIPFACVVWLAGLSLALADVGLTVSQPGLFKFQAPSGWKITTDTKISDYPMCKGPSHHDFIPYMSVALDLSAAGLSNYVAELERQLSQNPQFQKIQVLEDKPFTTSSGLKGERILIAGIALKPGDGPHPFHELFYAFSRHWDSKILVGAGAAPDDMEKMEDMFDEAVKTLTIE